MLANFQKIAYRRGRSVAKAKMGLNDGVESPPPSEVSEPPFDPWELDVDHAVEPPPPSGVSQFPQDESAFFTPPEPSRPLRVFTDSRGVTHATNRTSQGLVEKRIRYGRSNPGAPLPEALGRDDLVPPGPGKPLRVFTDSRGVTNATNRLTPELVEQNIRNARRNPGPPPPNAGPPPPNAGAFSVFSRPGAVRSPR